MAQENRSNGAPDQPSRPDDAEIARQVQELLHAGKTAEAAELLQERHPPDQSEVFQYFPDEATRALLELLPVEATADIVEELNPEDAVELAGMLESAEISQLLDETTADVAADILQELPPEEAR